MFKIIDYRSSSGKILITIETDDLTSSLFLQFLSEADKFAELFHYRLTTEKRIDSSQKNKPEQLARATKSRADLLKKYKEIIGSRQQRLKILRQMCITEGSEITQDRLIEKLHLAIEEDKLHK